MKRLCVLLPCHNEAEAIGRVVSGVHALELPDTELTPLVVDDGSQDATAEAATVAGAQVVTHVVNRGVGAAFRTGVEWALEHDFDYLVHMDADGQILPEEIPLLYGPVARGDADLALGVRFLAQTPEHMARWKAWALQTMARTIGALTFSRLHDISCGFRCMNRKVMEAVRPTFDYDYIQETLLQALAVGARVIEVPVTALYEEEPKRAGMSGRTLRYGSRFLWLTGYGLFQFYRTRARRLLTDRPEAKAEK